MSIFHCMYVLHCISSRVMYHTQEDQMFRTETIVIVRLQAQFYSIIPFTPEAQLRASESISPSLPIVAIITAQRFTRIVHNMCGKWIPVVITIVKALPAS